MEKKPPKVSIGLPVYNGERFLDEALAALAAQTHTDFELIISDNASTDDTDAICRRWASKDPRIRYLRHDFNMGAAVNYNRVFNAARGEYFKWASHDDLCHPNFLEKCVRVLDTDPSIVLCYAKTMIIDENSNDLGEYIEAVNLGAPSPHERLRSHLFESPGECNAVFGVFRSSVLKETSLIGKFKASDMILLGEVALRGKMHRIPEMLFLRRDHPQTSLRSNKTEADHARWFDTNARQKIYLPRWRWLFEYLRAIRRASLHFGEKLWCYTLMARWFVWSRGKLKRDIVRATRTLTNRVA